MTWSGLSDPNTNLKFHLFLLAFSLINVFYGIALLSLPLIAWVISRWVVMFFSELSSLAEEEAVGEWNGRYYAYDDQQVKIHWDSAGPWIEAADIFRLLGEQPEALIRERIRRRVGADDFRVHDTLGVECFSAKGASAYLSGRSDLAARKILNWLERNVFPNLERLREKDAPAWRDFDLDRRG